MSSRTSDPLAMRLAWLLAALMLVAGTAQGRPLRAPQIPVLTGRLQDALDGFGAGSDQDYDDAIVLIDFL